jgi:hypothetical protein
MIYDLSVSPVLLGFYSVLPGFYSVLPGFYPVFTNCPFILNKNTLAMPMRLGNYSIRQTGIVKRESTRERDSISFSDFPDLFFGLAFAPMIYDLDHLTHFL